ncbi:plasma membrane ATPase 4 [Ceratobasidium sp. AG-Ba]|nr:plasma membrane ATPase 4 [Ceratobasidium sp. AG-Ba]
MSSTHIPPMREHKCPHCPALFTSTQARSVHLVDAHEGAGSSSPGPSSRSYCRHCGISKPTRRGIGQHIRTTVICHGLQEVWLQYQIILAGMSPRSRRHANTPGSPSPSAHAGSDVDMEARNDGGEDRMEEADEGVIGTMWYDKPVGAGPGDEMEEDGVPSEYGGDVDSEAESERDPFDSDDEDDAQMADIPSDDELPRRSSPQPSLSNRSSGSGVTIELCEETDRYGQKLYVQEYGIPTVGKPIRRATEEELSRGKYPDVGQLSDRQVFDLAQLLMELGMSAGYRNKLFRLRRLRDQMPYRNNREMIIDIDKLPHGAGWSVQALAIEGDRGIEIVELWMRDAFEIIKQLLRNKRLGKFMQFRPIKKWTSRDMTDQIRDDIHTADWMWEMQGEIEDDFGTIIPVIISSDETKLTNFSGDKKAHPVYLTIGNIPKRLRRRTSKRGNILLGYLPVPKLDCESNKDERRLQRRHLFHQCMRALVKPLAEAAKTGVEVPCADGGVRRIYPLLASYVADFPEQCKVACIKQTHCPLCTVHPRKKGDLGDAPPRTHEDVVDAMEAHRGGGSAKFERMGLFDVDPFWRGYPHVRVDCLMTPDLLHQVHKGVMKDHLTRWVTEILGKQIMDERHSTMPEFHGMRHFKNGITGVSQWTGRELKEMAKILLSVVSDQDEEVVAAARALLDFMYLAHSSSLTNTELDGMERCLRTFHRNKSVFEPLGALQTKQAFHGIPKLHMIQHYVGLIRMLGTPDGYNTETSERLHIDFAKVGYKASNRVNAIKQMAMYIQRIEALAMHEEYLDEIGEKANQADMLAKVREANAENLENDDEWEDEEEEQEDIDDLNDAKIQVNLAVMLDEFLSDGQTKVGGRWEKEKPADQGPEAEPEPERFHPVPELVIAKTPTDARVKLSTLEERNNAPRLLTSLTRFLKTTCPDFRSQIPYLVTPETKVSSWSRARLFHSPPPFKPSEGPHIDVIRAQPAKFDRFDRVSRPARFDTVLISNKDRRRQGIHRYTPARVRAIFELPPDLQYLCDEKLAHVDMFYSPSQNPKSDVGLHTATRALHDGIRVSVVIPLSRIAMTCHLAPRYNRFRPETPLIQYSDILQLCDSFYINIFASHFLYELFRHWGQAGGTA